MILLSFGSAVLASLGRGDLIDEVEVPVRYTMFTTPLQVGLLCLVLPRVARDCVSSRARLLTSALGLALAVTLLTQQLFVGRAAAQIASAISVDADCFAEGGGIGAAVSPIVTRTPEKAQAVLRAGVRRGCSRRGLRTAPIVKSEACHGRRATSEPIKLAMVFCHLLDRKGGDPTWSALYASSL